MVRFTTTIKKFEKQGEKTGWTYIEITPDIARKLMPGRKTSFAVRGTLDNYSFRQVSLLPMGGGSFIMALKADVRKAIGKRAGYKIDVSLEADETPYTFSGDFLRCLNDAPEAETYFQSLPYSHRKYFSKWIDSAKTAATKEKRILMAVNALARRKGYGEMIRDQKKLID
jgi:hypothetical protein